MPKDFTAPSRRPVEALQTALGEAVPVKVQKGPTIVNILGQRCSVKTHQKSKSTWVASGDYNGVRHTAEDRTEGAAVKRWEAWAVYKARA